MGGHAVEVEVMKMKSCCSVVLMKAPDRYLRVFWSSHCACVAVAECQRGHFALTSVGLADCWSPFEEEWVKLVCANVTASEPGRREGAVSSSGDAHGGIEETVEPDWEVMTSCEREMGWYEERVSSALMAIVDAVCLRQGREQQHLATGAAIRRHQPGLRFCGGAS